MMEQLAAQLGIKTPEDLLKILDEIESPQLNAFAEDLPHAATSTILSLFANPAALVSFLEIDQAALGNPTHKGHKLAIKMLLAASMMTCQELDKRIPPRRSDDANPYATADKAARGIVDALDDLDPPTTRDPKI